jgi:NAD(P)-dependent dehydrogenase (short-subunit alcohol dehydrogenase family)
MPHPVHRQEKTLAGAFGAPTSQGYDLGTKTSSMPVALVTGANRGLGLEMARQLLGRGYTVHATYRDHQGGLTELNHPDLCLHAMDVRDTRAVTSVVASIETGLDLLVNNAGVSDGRWSRIEDIDFDTVSEVLNINAVSPVKVTQHCLPLLDRAGGGTVVMLSSLMASLDDCQSGKSYAYRASKTALNMFTVAMKNELAERNISLLLIHPGWVETDMGGPNAPVKPEESVEGILDRIEEQTVALSGRFVEYTGRPLPW